MKKRQLYVAAALAVCAALALGGCKSDSDGEGSGGTPAYAVDESLAPPAEGYIRINTLSKNAQNVWVWDDFDETEVAKCNDWAATGDGVQKTGNNGDFVYFDIKLAEDPQRISFIVRSGSGDTKVSGSSDITFMFPYKYEQLYLKSGSGTVYVDKDCTQKAAGLVSAEISGEHAIAVTTQNASLTEENVKVTRSGQALTVTAADAKQITVSEDLKSGGSVVVEYTDNLGTDRRNAGYSTSLIDGWFALDEDGIASLGYHGGTFKTWAPTATDVKVLLFKDAATLAQSSYEPEAVVDMKRNDDGTWVSEDAASKVSGNGYYKYRITNNGTASDVCDIWAKVASYESAATQITEITAPAYENPFGNTGVETKGYTDAVIYEMHITDWSQAFRSSVQEDTPGTFQEITAALGANGSGEFATHLKDLGVTHVQILPMFEYAVTTKRSQSGATEVNNGAYNWGYNPYNWNTPESRYAKDMKDGADAVKAMQDMVAAFHEAGIAVIMDVVYNHTNGTGSGSIYDMTVPGYFYRETDYSGCGNAVNTANKMVKSYVIDSLKHWMKDYGINGFRFDLMGIHESETMKEIYEELSNIDKNVMVYGEPWTGNGSYPADGCKGAVAAQGSNGVGAFDDDFRDAIKGAEFGGFQMGQVQGIYNDSGILKGLLGESGSNSRNTTGKPGLALHYVECHDNYTLYDKLAYSSVPGISGDNIAEQFPSKLGADALATLKKQDKLAAAYVFLSQGTPFINGGQEFLRTKQGDPDSYAADTKGGKFWGNIDEVNAINLEFKTKYSDVYDTYRGLIALRKANPEAFGANTSAKAETVSTGVTKYTAGDFLVYFNATDDAADIATAGYTKAVDVSSGAPIESATLPTSVPAKGFVILKNEK